jgi:hypothetical protein
MGNDNGNDPAPAEQRDAPAGEAVQEAQRNWTSVLASDANQVAVSGAVMALGYGAKKAADKFRKPPEPPPPPPPAAAAPPSSDGK